MGVKSNAVPSAQGGADAESPGNQATSTLFAGTPATDSADNIVDAGTEILERYEATPGCELVYAGYIDLFGNVWACLVTGPGWAELSVVRVGEDGLAQTSVTHIDAPFQALDGEVP